MEDHLKRFDEIAKQICELHRRKDESYGSAFESTCDDLQHGGKFYAVGCLLAKVGRLKTIVTKDKLDTFNESMKDTLMDLASYSIMTLISLEDGSEMRFDTSDEVDTADDDVKCAIEFEGFTKIPIAAAPDKKCETIVENDLEDKLAKQHYQVKPEDLVGDISGFPIEVVQRMVDNQVKQGNKADVKVFQRSSESSQVSGGFNFFDCEEGDYFGNRLLCIKILMYSFIYTLKRNRYVLRMQGPLF